MLADNNLLVHLYVKLSLWRNLVEATTAGITLHVNDSKAVACVLANTLEALQQALLNLQLYVLSLCLQDIFLFASLLHDLVKLVALILQVALAVVDLLVNAFAVSLSVSYALLCLTNLLLTEFYFQCLEINLLSQSVILTVVFNIVKLLLVAINTLLSFFNVLCTLAYSVGEVLYLLVNAVETYAESLYLVLQVFYLKWKFSAQCALLVNLRQGCLQLEESLQLFFHSQILRVFSCHNYLLICCLYSFSLCL